MAAIICKPPRRFDAVRPAPPAMATVAQTISPIRARPTPQPMMSAMLCSLRLPNMGMRVAL